jgi:hypothetical protein
MENYWTPALFVSAYNQIPGKKKPRIPPNASIISASAHH